MAMVDKICVADVITNEAALDRDFSVGTKWKLLEPLTEALANPNAETEFHTPTQTYTNSARPPTHQPVLKKKYGEIFDQPPFTGMIEVEESDRFK